MTPLRIAYADPPYLNLSRKHYSAESTYMGEVDHAELITTLTSEYPDGWALSCSSPSLRTLLPLCPNDTRVAAWVKPFHVFKKGVRPAYAWEPVLFRGGRNANHPPPLKGGTATTPRDWVSANITLQRGTVGAKPLEFSLWLFDLLGLTPADTFVDMFPGTCAVTFAWERFCGRMLPEFALPSYES